MLWDIAPTQLNPRVRYGGDRQVSVYIKVPVDKKGFTKIRINYDWIYDNGGKEISFMLSDSRSFKWSCGSRYFPRKEGTDEGVSGSPNGEIEIQSVNEPIYSIRIDIIFSRSLTGDDLSNIKVDAEYVTK